MLVGSEKFSSPTRNFETFLQKFFRNRANPRLKTCSLAHSIPDDRGSGPATRRVAARRSPRRSRRIFLHWALKNSTCRRKSGTEAARTSPCTHVQKHRLTSSHPHPLPRPSPLTIEENYLAIIYIYSSPKNSSHLECIYSSPKNSSHLEWRTRPLKSKASTRLLTSPTQHHSNSSR